MTRCAAANLNVTDSCLSKIWKHTHTPTRPTAHTMTSRLLQLPAELRSRIWRLALGLHAQPPTYMYDALAVFPLDDDKQHTATQPPLTRASRQLRQETSPMFYAFNTFAVTLWDDCWLDGYVSEDDDML